MDKQSNNSNYFFVMSICAIFPDTSNGRPPPPLAATLELSVIIPIVCIGILVLIIIALLLVWKYGGKEKG